MLWGPSSAHTHTQVKKKWSDLKVEVKRRVSAHGRSGGQNIFCVTFMPHTWKTAGWRCF